MKTPRIGDGTRPDGGRTPTESAQQAVAGEGLDRFWSEMLGGQGGAYSEARLSIARVLQGTGGESLLRSLEAAVESEVREILRAAYWRGYHAGYREASGDMLPILGQAPEPRSPRHSVAAGADPASQGQRVIYGPKGAE